MNNYGLRFIKNSIEDFKTVTHLPSIDMLRGIASLSVVFYHLVLGHSARFSTFPALQRAASFGHLGVQIFFVISGFVIPYAMYMARYRIRNFGTFLLKRFARLEPPYLISIVICILLAYGATISGYYRGLPPSFSSTQILSHFAYLNAFFGYDWINVVYWTLAIEFQYYILIALIFPILVSEKKYLFLGLLFLSAFLSYFFKQKEFILAHTPFFWCGIILFLLKIEKLKNDQAFGLLAIMVMLIFFTDGLADAMAGLIATMSILFIPFKNRICMFLGSISYSLYLLHVPIGQRIMNIAENFISNQRVMVIMLFVSVLILIAISWIYKQVVEEPSHRLARKIKY